MELSVKTLWPGLCSKVTYSKQMLDDYTPRLSSNKVCFSIQAKYRAQKYHRSWERRKYVFAACAVLEGVEDVEVSSPPSEDFVLTTSNTNDSEDFVFTTSNTNDSEDSAFTTNTNDSRELKISVVVSAAKTEEIFDSVFNKMVAAAQPIPGFRRVKGGKTPNIPRGFLLEALGPTKVYKKVITKIINTAVADYVQKENLRVTKNLRIEQSFEELEEEFFEDEEFSFDAVIELQETN